VVSRKQQAETNRPLSLPADNDGFIFSFDTAHPLIKSKESLVRNLMIMPSNPAGERPVACRGERKRYE
jgi:hypothetical protein